MTFKEWQKTAISEYTCEFGRCGIRDIYTLPNGVKIHDETWFPTNPFRPQTHQTLVDIMITEAETPSGAIWDEERYTDAGYGYPVFETTKAAFNYAMSRA